MRLSTRLAKLYHGKAGYFGDDSQRDDYAALLSAKDREIDTLKKQIAKLEAEIARLKTKP
jgi:cell division protein FtsB